MKVSRRQQSKSVSPSNFEPSLPKTHLAGGLTAVESFLHDGWTDRRTDRGGIVISCAAWHAALSVPDTAGLEIEAVMRTQSWQSAREQVERFHIEK